MNPKRAKEYQLGYQVVTRVLVDSGMEFRLL